MNAIFCAKNGYIEMDLEDAIGVPGKNAGLIVCGYTLDRSDERNMGVLVHREELDNLPKFEGFLGPMWDGNRVRYETQEVYDELSR